MLFNNKKAISISGINPASVMKGAGIIGKSTMPAAGMAASSVIGAAKGIGGGLLGGLGFGIGANAGANLTAGSSSIILAIVADIIAGIVFAAGGNPATFFMLAIGHYLLFSKYKRELGKDSWLILALFLNISPIIVKIISANYGFGFLNNEIFRLTPLGNGIFPIWFIYAGLLRNSGKGLISKAVYVLLFIGFVGWAIDDGIAQGAYADITAANPQEIGAVDKFLVGIAQGVATSGKTTLGFIRSVPNAVAARLNSQVGAAGGATLFGKEKEEQPKLGIVLEKHPSGATKSGDNTIIVKGLITIPNPLEDRSFLTVTKIRCYHTKSRTDAEVEGKVLEYTEETLQKGVNVFYNRPLTVSCAFDKEELGSVSTITLAVGYDFSSNAKLITYVMKDDLLEDLLVRNEDPLDYMAVPANKRKPVTRHDNGPARFGIGPVELNNPPLGVREEKTYPNFELVIGNKASDFNGHIGKINNIVITLPRGFSLADDGVCPFKRTSDEPLLYTDPNKYSISEEAMEAKSTDFTNIKTSRLFTCPMEITTGDALGTASFSQVEFNVDVGFTYETEADIPAKPRG